MLIQSILLVYGPDLYGLSSNLQLAANILGVITHFFMLVARFSCVEKDHHFFVRGLFHIYLDSLIFGVLQVAAFMDVYYDYFYFGLEEPLMLRSISLAMLLFCVTMLLPRLEIFEQFFPKDSYSFQLEGKRCHIMTSDDMGDSYGLYLSHRNRKLRLRGGEIDGLEEVWRITATDDDAF